MRVSLSGILILATYVGTIGYLFQTSIFYNGWNVGRESLGNNSSDKNEDLVLYLSLNAWTFDTSMLNVLSHFGVALGLLGDTLVISILAGVFIDIITRLLQLIWWIYLHLHALTHSNQVTSTMDMRGLGLLCFLSWIYYYHMEVHVRAIRVFLPSKKATPISSSSSLSRDSESLRRVLSSALNNLQGIPGKGYRDHLFAYTDLGSHVLACILSYSKLLEYEEGRDFIYSTAMKMLVSLSFVTFIALMTLPFQDVGGTTATHTSSLLCVDSNQILRCGCIACKHNESRKDHNGKEMSVSGLTSGIAAFTFNSMDGICRLWFKSFGDLQAALLLPGTKGCKST